MAMLWKKCTVEAAVKVGDQVTTAGIESSGAGPQPCRFADVRFGLQEQQP
jgi:hypothetical protein